MSFKPNPSSMFLIATVTIFIGKIAQARKDAQAEQEIREYRERQAAVKKAQAAARATAPGEQPAQPSPEPAKQEAPPRKRFELDADGFYMRDTNGNYLKTAERKERPPSDVANLIESLKQAEPQPTNGMVNKEVLKYLGYE